MFQTISFDNDLYPGLLLGVKDFPKELYIKGNLCHDSFQLCLGVVGSRRMTSYGLSVTEELVAGLVSYGITIVSGFMYGVDITAHTSAMKHGGKTIAVMPCGINLIYPTRHWRYYEELLSSGGLVVSEYLDDISPRKWMFLDRNRIVAGISLGVLVVEAMENSGSLITANFAREFGRKQFAVPGSIFSPTSYGANVLIKRGGVLVNSVEDIIVELGLLVREGLKKAAKAGGDSLENKIILSLLSAPKNYDQLLIDVQNHDDLRKSLMKLELEGSVIYKGGYYCVS